MVFKKMSKVEGEKRGLSFPQMSQISWISQKKSLVSSKRNFRVSGFSHILFYILQHSLNFFYGNLINDENDAKTRMFLKHKILLCNNKFFN